MIAIEIREPGGPEVLVVGAPASLPILRHEIVLQGESRRQAHDGVILVNGTTAAGDAVPRDAGEPAAENLARSERPDGVEAAQVHAEG